MGRRHEHISHHRKSLGFPAASPRAFPRGGAIPADEPRRDDGAWMGRLRYRAGDGRCLCRSSELRDGDHRQAARSPGFSGRHHCAAGLAVGRAIQGAGKAAPVFRRHWRQHGLDGQPLYGGPKAAPRRRLYARRRGRSAPGPLYHRLCPALPRGIQGRSDRAGRHRGVAAPHRSLRLLVRQGTPLDPGRCQGGLAHLRQRRARRRRGGAPARCRRRHRAISAQFAARRCFAVCRTITRSCMRTISTPPTRVRRAAAAIS